MGRYNVIKLHRWFQNDRFIEVFSTSGHIELYLGGYDPLTNICATLGRSLVLPQGFTEETQTDKKWTF